MNPSDMNVPPQPRRFPVVTVLLLCGMLVYFIWFFFMHNRDMHSLAIVQEGVTALSKKDTARARNRFDAFLRERPTDPLAYIAISEICLDGKEASLGVEYAQRGLDTCKTASNSQRASLYVELAQAQGLAEPAHPQTKAIASARTALSLAPQSPQMQNALGYMLLDNDQNLEEAEKLLRQALQSLKTPGEDPQSVSLRPAIEDSFGWLLYKKGDYVGAVAALNQATQDMPTGASGLIAKYFYYHLGAAYRKTGQTEEARRTLDIALQYDPTFPEAKAEAALLPPPNTPAASPSTTAPAAAPVVSAPAPSSTPAPSSPNPGLKL
jgi:Tfp pilus assembly protein PilF